MRILVLALVLVVTASSASAQVNLTGTWQPKYWTVKMALQQEGDRVWGYGGAQDFWYRGHWDGRPSHYRRQQFRPEEAEEPVPAARRHGRHRQSVFEPDDDVVG